MWVRWKRLKLRPWHWLTDKICEEHIQSLIACENMFQDARRMESEHESKKREARDGSTHSKGL